MYTKKRERVQLMKKTVKWEKKETEEKCDGRSRDERRRQQFWKKITENRRGVKYKVGLNRLQKAPHGVNRPV